MGVRWVAQPLYHRPVSDASTHNHDAGDPHRIGRAHPTLARILRRWRELTGGRQTRDPERRTLVACSGGADSVLLAMAIASVRDSCVVAHITHDLRAPELTTQDHEFVQDLAARLGVPFQHERIQTAAMCGNTEANARMARYSALVRLAGQTGCRFIATGHHADDQLETLLMHLMRGSGVRGMIGVHAAQRLEQHTLIRPMLDLSRDEIESALSELELTWREDHTNTDITLLRNRLRHTLIPKLREISPAVALHASEWGRDLAAIHDMVQHQIQNIAPQRRTAGGQWQWDRDTLRNQSLLLLGYLPSHYLEQEHGRIRIDQLTRRAIESWARAVKSHSTDPTIHRIGPIVARVRANQVVLSLANDDSNSQDRSE